MWYKDKTQACFECTGCGDCCRREGEVYISDKEVQAIEAYAKAEGISLNLTHIRLEHEGLWSVPIPKGGACPLLSDEGLCTVHPVKPWQCRAYPFWPEIMLTKATWDEEAPCCEGMNRGPSHDAEVIDAFMRQDPFLQDD